MKNLLVSILAGLLLLLNQLNAHETTGQDPITTTENALKENLKAANQKLEEQMQRMMQAKKRRKRRKKKRKKKKAQTVSGFSGPVCHLKLYWEKGYFWQEESFEREWCLGANSNAPRLEKCDRSEYRQKWIFRGGTIRPINDEDECVTAYGGETKIQKCNGDSRQQFHGFKEGGRFELSHGGRLLTNHHHPRSGEPLIVQEPVRARRADTSYWECM